jgi:hypothetical protein
LIVLPLGSRHGGESLLEKVELLLRSRVCLLHSRFLFLRGFLLRLPCGAAFFRAAFDRR